MNINFSALGGVTDITVSFENPTNFSGTGLPVNENSGPSGQYSTLLDNGGPNTGVGYPGATGGVWTVIPNSYATTPVYSMTLYGRNYDNAGSYQHSIIKRNTFCPGTWSVDGTYNTNSVAGNVVTAYRTGMTGFSQFAIAKTLVPLPVELALFDAACSNQNTVLSWVTASEQNNSYFSIERSCDENIFQYQTIATIPGAGNSNTMREYSFTDSDATAGDCYYRLSQTDFDGTTTVFAPIMINCKENAAFNFIGVLPNPAYDKVNILFTSISPDPILLNITDMMGNRLASKEFKPVVGLNKIEFDMSEFNAGVYFMNLTNGTKSYMKKVVKK
jgi:hypothetical protein